LPTIGFVFVFIMESILQVPDGTASVAVKQHFCLFQTTL